MAAGYEDCDDIDALKGDPALKIAVGRAPESGADLMSQPLSRLENLPDWRALARIGLGQIDLYCRSFARPPCRIVLDIDDTDDPAHGQQELALFNAHYDCTCFQLWKSTSLSRRILTRRRFHRSGCANANGNSVREAAILNALIRGAPNKVIAYQLCITEATVKVHVKAILRKIQAKNRTQAAIWALYHQALPKVLHVTWGDLATAAATPRAQQPAKAVSVSISPGSAGAGCCSRVAIPR